MEQQLMQETLDALNARIAKTKECIIDVLTQIDDIRFQQNPQIEADYAVKIGYLENAVLEADLAMRRAKRKLSIIQAQVNVGEPVNVDEVEAQLDAEFEAWQRKAEEALARYYEMLERRAGTTVMSPADARELKSLYRSICKRLHPDVCSPDDELASLFSIAQQAYAVGDLAVLRSLSEVIGEAAEEAPLESVDEANAQLAVLEAQLSMNEAELEAIKAEFPYAMKERLADPSWVTARVRELKAQRKELDQARQEYEARIARVMEGGGRDE